MRKVLAFLPIIAMVSGAWSAPSYIPVVTGQFMTGQWYFEGERSALGGNAGVMFVPAVRFSNRFSLIPSVESNYRGTRSAEELAGGTNLFQDTWENAIGVKAVHGLNSRWNLRERVSYRHKWFRETTDESFSDGLYDYNILTTGAEIERHWKKKASVALGYDFSLLRFPNYTSLESEQTPDLAREFSGDNVLDQRIHVMSLRTHFPLPAKISGGMSLIYSPRQYPSQHVVKLTGLLSSEEREDTLTGGSMSLERMFDTPRNTKLVTQVNYSYSSLDSNQNHYDARLTEFIGNFYDYDQHAVGTQMTLAFGKMNQGPMMIEAGYSYSMRDYGSRVIQDVDGNYMGEKLYVNESAVNLGFSYPLTRNFRLRTSASFGRSSSNNDYETLYRYNYSNSTYLFGVTFDY